MARQESKQWLFGTNYRTESEKFQNLEIANYLQRKEYIPNISILHVHIPHRGSRYGNSEEDF